jgi:hypothetical protein
MQKNQSTQSPAKRAEVPTGTETFEDTARKLFRVRKYEITDRPSKPCKKRGSQLSALSPSLHAIQVCRAEWRRHRPRREHSAVGGPPNNLCRSVIVVGADDIIDRTSLLLLLRLRLCLSKVTCSNTLLSRSALWAAEDPRGSRCRLLAGSHLLPIY